MTTRFVYLERAPERAEARPRIASALWISFFASWFFAVLVFWAFEAMPFQDLPAHAGLIALRQRFATSAFDQKFFVLASHVGPYTLFRVLGEGCATLLGPLRAVRVLATLPTLALPIGLLVARRMSIGRWDPVAGLLGVILSFGFMTVLGFASYLLGLALLVITLPFWFTAVEELRGLGELRDEGRAGGLRDEGRAGGLRDEGRAGRTAAQQAVVGLSLLLFIAHGHAFVLFLAIATVSLLLTRPPLRAALLLVPAVSLAAGVFLFERTYSVPAGSVPFSPHMGTTFQGLTDKLSLLITPTLMTRFGVDFAVGIAVWVFTLILTFTLLTKWAHLGLRARSLLLVTGVLFAAFLALPHNIRWFGFVDGRLVPLFIILPFLAAGELPFKRIVEVAAPGLAAIMVGCVWLASARFQKEAEGYREVLGRIPSEMRILNLPVDPNSDVFTGHPFVHYDKLVLLDRSAVPSDVWFHQGTALYPTAANPSLALPESYVESNLSTIDWPAYNLASWDYVLIRSRDAKRLGAVPETLTLVEQRGAWWLYQRRL
jgi:hypothetical protein